MGHDATSDAVGEKDTHTQLLNGIGPFLCNFVVIPHLTNAEKVAHHRIVFLHGDACGPHRGVAPLLRIGQLCTSPKSTVVTLDTMIGAVLIKKYASLPTNQKKVPRVFFRK